MILLYIIYYIKILLTLQAKINISSKYFLIYLKINKLETRAKAWFSPRPERSTCQAQEGIGYGQGHVGEGERKEACGMALCIKEK